VEGIYQFVGLPASRRVPIVYPIASGRGLGHPTVELVELTRAAQGASPKTVRVPFEQSGKQVRFTLVPGDSPEYSVRVRYRQVFEGRSATYLTTTARAWRRPLSRAWFQVIVDRSLGSPRFDMPFKEVPAEDPSTRRFSCEISPYLAERDVEVRW